MQRAYSIVARGRSSTRALFRLLSPNSDENEISLYMYIINACSDIQIKWWELKESDRQG